MKGQILDYNYQTKSGVISGGDGVHYTFYAVNWHEADAPVRGTQVDFMVTGTNAVSVCRSVGATVVQPKSRVAAALFALFLGWIGVHKFYLGYHAQRVILLVCWLLSLVLVLVIVGIVGLLAIAIITFVEFIVYLNKSDEEFHQIYVLGRKTWF